MANNNLGVDLFTPANPNVPYVQIKLNGRIYDLDINFLRDFTVERPAQDVGTFSFTLVDVFDLNLEKKIAQLIADTGAPQDFSFQYGWTYGDKSPWYFGRILDYEPTFLSNMNLSLSISGQLLPEEECRKIRSYKGWSISEIVEQIARQEQWTIQALDKTDRFSQERTFNQGNLSSVEFIRQKLVPEATQNGNPFKFYIETVAGTAANGCNMYFVRYDKFKVQAKNYAFSINAGNYGSVISFAPQYKGTDIAFLGQEAGFFDGDTNEISVYGSEGKYAGQQAELTIYGSTSPDRMKALLSNKWFERNLGNYVATMEIYGDPTLAPLRYVNVLPMLPNGEVHHTGGTYMIMKITDTISGGFKTSLDLQKMEFTDANGRTSTLALEDTVTLRSTQ